ncbi:shikimate dehydrogenase [Rhizobium alvei]|uniref:Shikimate dehydrogenase (NADP(+)) n=1 Tax=Rhizobium alvei TaxID=1132659 RepID=A0ABT8YTK2_9HYPH|nr:shikimate dehydrogenase [Rhizobium alvei]MDO6966697.1 shikimate dehydrogenase [Rhizobium alvei]
MANAATDSVERTRPRTKAVQVGLIGAGIQKSRTPAMHEAEGAALGLNYSYRLFDTLTDPLKDATLPEIVRAAELCGFAGLNITFPYKVAVIDHLDELSPAAEMAGAVNTVVFRNGRRSGHNTDLWGFAESFRRNMGQAARSNVLLVGAGGAGKAVAHALIDCGVERLWIHDADRSRAEILAEAVSLRHGAARALAVGSLSDVDAQADGIVNATPVGMAEHPGLPVPDYLIRPQRWVADIVYFPLDTELLRVARQRGCRTLSGAGMAVFQAVRAFELFSGEKPDVGRMEATFRSFDVASKA